VTGETVTPADLRRMAVRQRAVRTWTLCKWTLCQWTLCQWTLWQSAIWHGAACGAGTGDWRVRRPDRGEGVDLSGSAGQRGAVNPKRCVRGPSEGAPLPAARGRVASVTEPSCRKGPGERGPRAAEATVSGARAPRSGQVASPACDAATYPASAW